MMKSMITAIEAAHYFLSKQDRDEPDISNLKLLKLVYYAQAWSLAYRGRPLFGDQIEAWKHGPVVPEIYHQYKHYGRGAIAKLETSPELPELDRELLDMVYTEFGRFSAWHLRVETHAESPWKEAYHRNANAPISMDSIGRYFREKWGTNPFPDFEQTWKRSIPIEEAIAGLA
jgi:uncharacterized phage-associated protein